MASFFEDRSGEHNLREESPQPTTLDKINSVQGDLARLTEAVQASKRRFWQPSKETPDDRADRLSKRVILLQQVVELQQEIVRLHRVQVADAVNLPIEIKGAHIRAVAKANSLLVEMQAELKQAERKFVKAFPNRRLPVMQNSAVQTPATTPYRTPASTPPGSTATSPRRGSPISGSPRGTAATGATGGQVAEFVDTTQYFHNSSQQSRAAAQGESTHLYAPASAANDSKTARTGQALSGHATSATPASSSTTSDPDIVYGKLPSGDSKPSPNVVVDKVNRKINVAASYERITGKPIRPAANDSHAALAVNRQGSQQPGAAQQSMGSNSKNGPKPPASQQGLQQTAATSRNNASNHSSSPASRVGADAGRTPFKPK